MKYILLLCIACLLSFSIYAQKGYKQGYVINLEGDSLAGLVKDRDPQPFEALYQKIRFKSDEFFFKKRFQADEIRGYGYEGKHFVSLPIREETAFFRFRYYIDPSAEHQFLLRIKQNERLVYYEWEFIFDDNNMLSSFPVFHRPERSEMVRVTQGMFGFKKKRLREYFTDCPGLIEELERDSSSFENALDIYHYYLQECGE